MRVGAKKVGASGACVALVLSFFFFSGSVKAAGTPTCTYNNELAPGFDPGQKKAACGLTKLPECMIVLAKVEDASKKLAQQLKDACERTVSVGPELTDFLIQKDSYGKAKDLFGSLADDFQRLSDSMNAEIEAIRNNTIASVGPLKDRGKPGARDAINVQKQNIWKHLSPKLEREKLKNDSSITSVPNSSGTGSNSQLFAARNAAAFMRRVIVEQEKVEKMHQQFLEYYNKAQEHEKNSGPDSTSTDTDTRTNDKSGGGLLSMSSLNGLATLATAGMGLMSALQPQQETPSDLSAATSPTPNASNGPQISSLGEVKANTTGTTKAPGPAAPKEEPIDPVYSGSSDTDSAFSDISKTSSNTASGGAIQSTKVLGGDSAGGASGFSDSKREPSAAVPPPHHPEEEALQGIGNGGLGGGGPSSSSSSSEHAEPPVIGNDDSMKDLLNDMKDTAEGGDPFPGDGMQGSGDSVVFTAEDLFPRVHSCITRKLKQGQVLNGLGDRISP